MKYIYKKNQIIGENPIQSFQLCWYDMAKHKECIDENFIDPTHFNYTDVAYIDCDQNEGDIIRTRLFVHTKDNQTYELCLHKIPKDKFLEYSSFFSGRDI